MSRTRAGSSATASRNRLPVLIGAAILVLVAAAALWFLVLESDDDETPGAIATRAASAKEIQELSKSLDYPLYWAGAQRNMTYELTKTDAGRVYIRYLPRGVRVGTRSPNYLTIGTYPQTNGYAAVRTAGAASTASTRQLSGGALVVTDSRRPRSVYFSFPDAKFQVEVFDPKRGRARSMTYSGEIQRVS